MGGVRRCLLRRGVICEPSETESSHEKCHDDLPCPLHSHDVLTFFTQVGDSVIFVAV